VAKAHRHKAKQSRFKSFPPVQPEITTDIFNYERHEKHEK